MHTAGTDADPEITEEELRKAIDERQLRLYYLPKVECETLILKGFEALLRWEHPTRGLVMPDRFVRVAEDAGLIGRVTELVVDESLDWYRASCGIQGLTLSINISAKRLSDLDFADWLQSRCRRASVRPECVILEISESAVMSERLHALDMFNRLREKGFQVAVDQFGIGRYSLSMLARLPFSEVKIEKSFAMSAKHSDDARAFIKATTELAHRMSLTVVAEGVEDRVALEYVRRVRCDFIQGFLISRPMSGEQAREWMVNRHQMIKHMLI